MLIVYPNSTPLSLPAADVDSVLAAPASAAIMAVDPAIVPLTSVADGRERDVGPKTCILVARFVSAILVRERRHCEGADETKRQNTRDDCTKRA